MQNLILTTNQFILANAIMIILLLLTIYLFRSYLKREVQHIDRRNNKHSGKLIRDRNKFPELNIRSYSGMFFRFGLLLTLSFVLFAFSWTQFNPVDKNFQVSYADNDELVFTVPNVWDQPKPKAALPEVILELPDEAIEDSIEFLSQDIDINTEIFADALLQDIPDEQPVFIPPEDKDVVAEIPFRVVEEMPRFPGCEGSAISTEEKKKCAEKELLAYLYKNLKYPTIARETGVEGVVVIQFVVTKNGNIENVSILREIGGGCGTAAAEVVKAMNELPEKWSPGKQRGKSVPVFYTLPVKFKLQQ